MKVGTSLLIVFVMLLSACSHRTVELSRQILPATGQPAPGDPAVGLIADSQLQSLPAWSVTNLYRQQLADKIIKVTIRPPALDWTSRYLLLAHLEAQRLSGARAIFYLGDGANHGCTDEFTAGLSATMEVRKQLPLHSQGVLAILDTFRREAGVPVFFVLGNHDFLGAGNTSSTTHRQSLCAHSASQPNPPLAKFDVIEAVDRFNRGNTEIAGDWVYQSSFTDPSATRAHCEAGENQQRQWGCYLAAVVDHRASGRNIQYLLLDTNDYLGVSSSSALGHEFEGLRGAMSFGAPRNGIISQTGWFEGHVARRVDMRIALMHYDVEALRKKLPGVGAISKKSQQFMNLFTRDDATPLQADAYAVSAHTHAQGLGVFRTPFSLQCGTIFCRPGDRPAIKELNVGSTTDHPSLSAVLRWNVASETDGGLRYEVIRPATTSCRAIEADLLAYHFPRPVGADSAQTGWAALGIKRAVPNSYHGFKDADLKSIWENLSAFVKGETKRGVCVGLEAAAVEARQPKPY
ncbi:hypothetical protein ACFOMD_01565 [Sphingoaurantiacus capsulatus]|uniref:Calcineurin-like phosphoesterase domain-containing protein n=1 Tax=Sphingoaurantiacus capsulatus TaxID=1771310 RepID=A0ABV7X9B9_9SPHN